MEQDLRDSVRAVLAAHLPAYRENREHFPLWTYHRSPQPFPTWGQIRFWPERLRWSPVYPVLALDAELRRSAIQEGFDIVANAFPTHADLLRRGDADNLRVKRADARVRIPLRLQARFRAAYAATSVRFPDSPSDLDVPRDVAGTWGLDEFDRRQLADSLVGTLLRGVSIGVDGRGRVVGHRAEQVDDSGLRKGDYFGRLVHLAADSFQVSDDEALQEKLAARRKTLATEYLTEAGLLAERRGGRKTTLPREFLNAMRREVRILVEKVHDYRPTSQKVEVLAGLIEDDRELRNLDRATKGYGDPVIERLRRTSLDAKHQTDRPPLPWLLQFPFLTPTEIALCRDADGVAREHGLDTPLQIGDHLMTQRLLPNRWARNSIYELAGSIT